MGGSSWKEGGEQSQEKPVLSYLLQLFWGWQQGGIILSSLALHSGSVISETEVDGSAGRQREEILVKKLPAHTKGVEGYWAPREAANLVLSPGCPQLQCSEEWWAPYSCFGPKAQEKGGIKKKLKN